MPFAARALKQRRRASHQPDGRRLSRSSPVLVPASSMHSRDSSRSNDEAAGCSSQSGTEQEGRDMRVVATVLMAALIAASSAHAQRLRPIPQPGMELLEPSGPLADMVVFGGDSTMFGLAATVYPGRIVGIQVIAVNSGHAPVPLDFSDVTLADASRLALRPITRQEAAAVILSLRKNMQAPTIQRRAREYDVTTSGAVGEISRARVRVHDRSGLTGMAAVAGALLYASASSSDRDLEALAEQMVDEGADQTAVVPPTGAYSGELYWRAKERSRSYVFAVGGMTVEFRLK